MRPRTLSPTNDPVLAEPEPRGIVATKTFAEFFAGVGLVHEALAGSGWQCIYANDIDEKKREMYEGHFGQLPYFHLEDVWNTKEVLSHLTTAPFLATASFPCIDLSLAGHWRGLDGEHSSTFFGFVAVLDRMGARRPAMVMVENVLGFLTSHGGRDFERACVELGKLGYWLDAIVLDARHFVPQSRPRVFLLGFKPHVADSSGFVRQGRDSSPLDPWRSAVAENLRLRTSDIVSLMERIDLPTGWVASRLPQISKADYSLTSFIDLDTDQDWWDQAQTERHYEMMQAPSKRRVDDLCARGATAAGTAFRRTRLGKTRTEVRFDVAGCLRTPKGGSARQIVVAILNGRLCMRWMSPREYARLQGSPEYRIRVPDQQAMYGFGDAVCVPAVQWIDRHILTPAFEASASARQPLAR